MIENLRAKIRELEARTQFDKRPYPLGIEPFPRILQGQGFFPGGDGLWREDAPSALRSQSTCLFPRNGIMFLGNDFGTFDSFSKLKLHENPRTWRHLRKRLIAGGIAGQLGFYTNAYLGLRNDRCALADGIQHKEYDEMCADFLSFQISVQEPKLIVVLGNRPCSLLQSALSIPQLQLKTLSALYRGASRLNILLVSHPYSDLGKSPDEIRDEGDLLRESWSDANR